MRRVSSGVERGNALVDESMHASEGVRFGMHAMTQPFGVKAVDADMNDVFNGGSRCLQHKPERGQGNCYGESVMLIHGRS